MFGLKEERNIDGYAVGSTHFDIKRLESGELPDILKEKILAELNTIEPSITESWGRYKIEK